MVQTAFETKTLADFAAYRAAYLTEAQALIDKTTARLEAARLTLAPYQIADAILSGRGLQAKIAYRAARAEAEFADAAFRYLVAVEMEHHDVADAAGRMAWYFERVEQHTLAALQRLD